MNKRDAKREINEEKFVRKEQDLESWPIDINTVDGAAAAREDIADE